MFPFPVLSPLIIETGSCTYNTAVHCTTPIQNTYSLSHTHTHTQGTVTTQHNTKTLSHTHTRTRHCDYAAQYKHTLTHTGHCDYAAQYKHVTQQFVHDVTCE